MNATVVLYFRTELEAALTALMSARYEFKQKIGLALTDRYSTVRAAGLTSISMASPSEAKMDDVMEAHAPYFAARLAFRQRCAEVARVFV